MDTAVSNVLGGRNLINSQICGQKGKECLHLCTLMRSDVRKPVFGVSNQVRPKPGFLTTENGKRLEISDLGTCSRRVLLSIEGKQRRLKC